jgi:hypothetical protein
VPPQGDYAYWRHLSLPVLAFLEEPRDWVAIEDWVKTNRFGKSRIRQMLAWLEQRGEAATVRVEGTAEKVCWASAAWLKRHSGPPHSRT